MLLAACVAAGGHAFVEQLHVGGLCAEFQGGQFLGVVGLDAQVVDARLVAARGDGEVDRRVFEHPLRVVAFDARRLRRE